MRGPHTEEERPRNGPGRAGKRGVAVRDVSKPLTRYCWMSVEPAEEQEPQVVGEITLYVANYPVDYTDNDLNDLFGKYGKIENISPMMNRPGKCFVTFSREEDGMTAIDELNNKTVDGRQLIVEKSKRPFLANYRKSDQRDNNRERKFYDRDRYHDRDRDYRDSDRDRDRDYRDRNRYHDRERDGDRDRDRGRYYPEGYSSRYPPTSRMGRVPLMYQQVYPQYDVMGYSGRYRDERRDRDRDSRKERPPRHDEDYYEDKRREAPRRRRSPQGSDQDF